MKTQADSILGGTSTDGKMEQAWSVDHVLAIQLWKTVTHSGLQEHPVVLNFLIYCGIDIKQVAVKPGIFHNGETMGCRG